MQTRNSVGYMEYKALSHFVSVLLKRAKAILLLLRILQIKFKKNKTYLSVS